MTYAAAVVAMESAFKLAFLGGSDGIVGIPPLPAHVVRQWASPAAATKELWPVCLGAADADPAVRAALPPLAARHQRADGADGPDLAQALGVDARSVRFLVFVASAPISALAGWLYAYQRAYVGPDMFESYFLVLMLTAIVIVGRRLLLGPLSAPP